MALYFFSFQV